MGVLPSLSASRASVIAAYAFACGCYAPHVVAGSPCGPNAPCPTELTCSPATQTCEYTATPIDAADARGDAALDGMSSVCLGPPGWTICTVPPTTPVTLSGSMALMTDTSTLCLPDVPQSWTDAGQSPACVIVGTTIDAPSLVHVHGMRPLVLVATDTITIAGELDVSTHLGSMLLGAGANSALCASFPSKPASDGYGGGGAGASFMSAGGDGGDGDAGMADGGDAPAADQGAPSVLRGGCAGQKGAGPTPGAGGGGGGAVYLVAGSSISVTASINASGEGGGDGGIDSGGGGGGAGGMIVLYAPSIVANGGVLIANGGGGASGGTASATGSNGGDPSVSTPTQPAAGGGGAGGAGFAVGANATSGAGGAAAVGGAAGGGGAGYIRSNVTPAGATVSPNATIVP